MSTVNTTEVEKPTRISRWELFEISVAILSLVVSGIALYVAKSSSAEANVIAKGAVEESRKANSFAEQALKEAKEANLTNRGELRAYPRIDTQLTSTATYMVSTIDEAKSASCLLRVTNKGKLPITAVRLRLYLLGGFTWQVNNPSLKVKHDSEDKQLMVAFGEQVLPGGCALIELRNPLLSLLHENRILFPNEAQVHESLINVVVVPQAVGHEAPVLSDRNDPTDQIVDRQIVTIRYSPKMIRSDGIKSLLVQPVKVNVFAF